MKDELKELLKELADKLSDDSEKEAEFKEQIDKCIKEFEKNRDTIMNAFNNRLCEENETFTLLSATNNGIITFGTPLQLLTLLGIVVEKLKEVGISSDIIEKTVKSKLGGND